jgi:4-hydroxythreonine-4-phosphate dehydrogenase
VATPSTPVIAVTIGDPAGVGPELTIKVLAQAEKEPIGQATLVVVGSDQVMKVHAAKLKIPYSLPAMRPALIHRETLKGNLLADMGSSGDERIPLGRPSATGGELAMACIEAGLDLVKRGLADALVTGPINKQSIGMAGFKWAGHTDFLADRTKTKFSVMMLVGAGMRVALVTHHVALAEVPRLITVELVLNTLRVLNRELIRCFDVPKPRIAVAGLNPHASDGGRFGGEEANVIIPAVRKALEEKIQCDGPHPPDTLFVPALRGRYDAILCMYHDQGLIPLKMAAFGKAVNITLGLPIIRTSVDHGTAYDIVGKGLAQADSMVEAIQLAEQIVARTKK